MLSVYGRIVSEESFKEQVINDFNLELQNLAPAIAEKVDIRIEFFMKSGYRLNLGYAIENVVKLLLNAKFPILADDVYVKRLTVEKYEDFENWVTRIHIDPYKKGGE